MSAVKAKVVIYDGDTLVTTCTCSDVLEKFKITREGDTAKFFGYGICHKLNVTFIDLYRTMPAITKGMIIKVMLGDGVEFDSPFPDFYITEVSRNEKTNNITCSAFDVLYNSASLTVQQLEFKIREDLADIPPSLNDYLTHCRNLLGCSSVTYVHELGVENIRFPEGANFVSDGNLRYVLDSLAEATQSVYYVNAQNALIFKRLDRDGDSVFTITKNHYYELDTQTPKVLTGICSTNELGDSAELALADGVTQYVRSNPFWDLREDITAILEAAISRVNGLTIYQFDCDWVGDYRLEVGDKISLVTETNETVDTYLVCDILEYSGSLNQITEWAYTEQESETANNPTNIGEKINQTFARVDKVKQEVEIVSGKADANSSSISSLLLTTKDITLSVEQVEQSMTNLEDSTQQRIDTLAQETALKVDAEGVEIVVENVLSEGVEKVVTASKKYTFDDSGLNVSSSGNNISTIITEDGMRVKRAGQEVLIANNEGVSAEDLHATTYLIIGKTSRLEDRMQRTACFWIGD